MRIKKENVRFGLGVEVMIKGESYRFLPLTWLTPWQLNFKSIFFKVEA